MSNSLVEIPRPQWQKLRDLYNEKRLYSSAYSLLQTLIEWIAKYPAEKLKIYALNGEWEEDGTFLVVDSLLHYDYVYCNTLSLETKRLHAALNCLDPKVMRLIAGFQKRLTPVIIQYFIDAGLSEADFKPDETVWFHCPSERVAKFTVDIPVGLTLARLDLHHAEEINNIWPHRAPGSVKFVERLIRYNDSVGAFNQAGDLVAWCLILPLGALGLLQVVDSYKRQGLGNLLVRYMAKSIAAKNLAVLAPVVTKNVASRAMFEKLGFEIIDGVLWVMQPAKVD